MTQPAYFLAADDRPFRDPDAAEAKRQMLSTEANNCHFEVVPLPDGGFAVASADLIPSVELGAAAESSYRIPEGPRDALQREMAEAGAQPESDNEPPPISGLVPRVTSVEPCDAAHGSTVAALPDRPDNRRSESGFPDRFTLHVAPRSFAHLHLVALLGTVLMLFPHWLFAPLGNFGGFQNPALGASVLGAVQLGGGLAAIAVLGNFLYTYALYRYVVTEDYVEANLGWISREAPKVFYAHIRTTTVVQSWWERLLIVGAVKIGTGATDQHEVVLKHISNPKRVESELERRYLPFIRAQNRSIDRS